MIIREHSSYYILQIKGSGRRRSRLSYNHPTMRPSLWMSFSAISSPPRATTRLKPRTRTWVHPSWPLSLEVVLPKLTLHMLCLLCPLCCLFHRSRFDAHTSRFPNLHESVTERRCDRWVGGSARVGSAHGCASSACVERLTERTNGHWERGGKILSPKNLKIKAP